MDKQDFINILKRTAEVAIYRYINKDITKTELETVKDVIFFQASFICDVIGWSQFCDEIENIMNV